MSDRPKVMLCAPHGAVSRYLLRTGVYPTLLQGADLVVVTPNADEEYMVEEFGDDVVLDQLPEIPKVKGRLRTMVATLRKYGAANGHKTRAFKNHYEGMKAQAREHSRWQTVVMDLGVQVLWRSRIARRFMLWLETRLDPARPFAELFQKHQPDLVVCGSPGVLTADVHALREAKRRGVRSAAVIIGWDNPTSKGYRGAHVDEVIVWSDRMAEQMAKYQDVPVERCFVGGVPFFDRYITGEALMSREELFAHHDLDPDRKLIVFATSSPTLWEMNEPIAETIAKAVNDGSLGVPAQLVIRVHPNYLRPGEAATPEGYGRTAREYDHVRVDLPDVTSQRLRIDRAMSDALRLGALWKHCDVQVNVFSTTTLEAFILDRPTVLVSEHVGLEGGSAGRGWPDFDHLQALSRHGAAHVADSLDDLPALIREGLLEPHRHGDARRRVAEEECGRLDGRSGTRVGSFLLAQAGAENALELPTSRPEVAAP